MIAGTISFKVNGTSHQVAGAFKYSIQKYKNEMLAGHDSVHGKKSMPKVPFIEGEIRDRSNLDLQALYAVDNATVTLELANGKTIMLRGACFCGDSEPETEDAVVPVRFEGTSGAEV
jgi:hypothetical protein